MIVAAAIKLHGRVYGLPAPARHHHIINHMAAFYDLATPILGVQGFIDDNEGFVDRETAGVIAVEQKQINRLNWPPELFSEDLW